MGFFARAWQDVVFGARSLAKHPSYTVTAFLTLALTIAAVSAMLSVVSQVVLAPLPVPDPDRIVAVEIRNPRTGADEGTESIPFAVFQRWQEASRDGFELAWAVIESSVLTETDVGVYSAGHYVSHNFLSMIGVLPLHGRWFDERDAGRPVLVISYDMWQRDLGGDENIVGRSISLDKNPHTVVGVMPEGYLGFLEPRLRYWRPVDGFGRGGSVLGRLPEGSTPGYVERAEAVLDRVLQQDAAASAVDLVPLLQHVVGSSRADLRLLTAAVSALFLVALLNLTNLVFARFYNRIHELTTRASLGATRPRLVGQLVIENMVLSVAAAVASIFVARWLLQLTVQVLPAAFPRKLEITVDAGIWIVAVLMAIGSGMLVTSIPGIRIANPARLLEQMKHGSSRLAAGFGSVRLRRHLIALQVGVALTLLVAVGLLVRSYANLLDREIGFDPERVVSGHIWRPEGFSDDEISLAFDRVLQEIAQLPEVGLVAAGSTIPMGPVSTRVDPTIGYSYRGQPALRDGEESRVALRTVTDDFFRVLDIGLVAGRFFDGREATGDDPTVIVNRALVETVWPGENAIGKELILEQRAGDRAYTVVGIVENYRFEGLRADVKPEAFLSMSQQVFGGASYIAKVRSDDPETTMQTIARIASQLDNSMPMIEVRAMDDLVVDSVDSQQSVLILLLGFAFFATLLAAVGIYGLTSYLIGRRTQEIAVRIALGADPNRIRRWVIADAALLAGLGVLIGLVLTIPLARLLGTLLFGVEPWDWQAYGGALLVVLLIAVLAPMGPASRAARVEPNRALRDQ